MTTERVLNRYFNKGGFNQPARIGYMMQMIRRLRPLTEEEWRIWYLDNVHDERYLRGLAEEMWQTIPSDLHIDTETCFLYICDVMFRRTFQGYNKEKLALKILQETISPDVRESSEDWDTLYFIDFYVCGANGRLIGIQLKPETFFTGGYQNIVDIEGKMAAFRQKYHALTYVLTYKPSTEKIIEFSDPALITEIKKKLV